MENNVEFDNLIKSKTYTGITNLCNNKNNINLLNYIINKTIFLNDYNPKFSERIYCLKNNITERPKCKFCNSDNVIFITSTKGYNSYCKNRHCIELHRKELYLEKYGVDDYSKTEEYKERYKKTMIEKYGVDHPMKSKQIKESLKKTCLEKYGVDNPNKNKDVRNKIKQTCLEKYGNEFYQSTDEYKNKIKQTCLEKYGVDSIWKLDSTKEKTKQTLLKKYGVDSTIKIKGNREKLKKGKYCKDIKKLTTICENDNIEFISYDIHRENKYRCQIIKAKCKKCNQEIEFNRQYLNYRIKNNWNLCYHCEPHKFTSKLETNLISDIQKFYNGEIIRNKRFDNFDGNTSEIDIYIPEFNIGIETNGLYWHSELYKDKLYHQNKVKLFNEKYNINLITLWEDDINNSYKYQIILSRIKDKLNCIENKIYARKCLIKIVDGKEAKQFLEQNHLQGYAPSSINIGLYYNNNLICITTFGKSRKSISGNKEGYELIRMCTLINTVVIGGFSKLIKYFVKNYNCKNLYSYSDLDWVKINNNSYEKVGFKFIKITTPDYNWVVNGIRENRIKYMKSKLKKFDNYSDNKTEVEIMHEQKCFRIFGTGNLLLEYNI